MLFHEIYSTYFQTVAKILTEAVDHPLTSGEIDSIVREYAFDESTLNIPESLGIAHWQLLKEDGTTILKKKPTMPLTILQIIVFFLKLFLSRKNVHCKLTEIYFI